MNEDEILKNLNQEQKEAVTFQEGLFLIIAGAGTGKTTVITKRMAWLISQKKAKPEEILAITFTEKAAREMEERIDQLLPYGYFDLWISTFHAFGERILRNHALEIGLVDDFKVLDQAGQILLIRQNLDKFNLDYYRPLGNPTKFIAALVKHFSRAKDEEVSPEEYLEYTKNLKLNKDVEDLKIGTELEEIKRLEELANAYHVYQQLLLQNNALDFGDLINYTLLLFRKRPRILEKYRNQFKYILVDEFQDTNWAQYELIKLLAAPRNNLTVCADDDQSIYKFRGASISNVFQFKKDFPQSKEVILIKNYRSKQNILDLAYKFIQLNNPNRLEYQCRLREDIDLSLQGKQLKTFESKKSTQAQEDSSMLKDRNAESDKIVSSIYCEGKKDQEVTETSFSERKIHIKKEISKKLSSQRQGLAIIEHLHTKTQEEEARMVVEKIIELYKLPQGFEDSQSINSWNDFAILVRANSQAEIFCQVLAEAEIPYQFLASAGLYTKPIILDILAYLKLLDNYHESSALYRVLNLPIFKISPEDIINLNYWASRKNWSLYETLKNISLLNISKEGVNEINKILSLIEKHTQMAREKFVGRVVFAFLEDSGYLKLLTQERKDKENLEKINYLNQFFKKIEEFERVNQDKSIKAFQREIEMAQEAGEGGALEKNFEEGPESVKILTVHGAKGLEFRYVFITNLADRRFPTIERKDPIELPDALVKEIIPEGDIHLQEERRLFYVAMTRAKDGLFFTSAENYGGREKKKLSRFLKEIGIEKSENQKGKDGLERLEKIEKVSIPKETVFYKLPQRFSFTQLKAFETCPLQYKFAHILHVPVKGRFTFSFGKSMHNTLYRFFQRWLEKKTREQKTLFPLEKEKDRVQLSELPTQKELFQIYETSWINEWYESKAHQEEYKEKGKKILKEFYEIIKKAPPQTRYLELNFSFKLKDYTIKGRIDRIDVIGMPGEKIEKIEIIDYKTGQAKEEEKLSSEDKDQLLIYQLAAKEIFREEIVNLSYYYLDNNKKISFLGTEKELETMKEKIIKTIEEIKKSDFLPQPNVHKCKFCDFKEICEARAI